ncbi:serpin family protein [Hyalangium gracile]|uniref:serpin family protein n=1 Tax=Hyalangium gracile TaxID=394092 RepID=UPI001CCB8028|nr:serpin family protein [Hyalangium gracile]
MTSPHRWLAPLGAAVLMLAGCSSSEPLEPEKVEPPGELVASEKARISEPGVAPQDFTALVSSNTDFGVDVYRKIARPGENLFFSPFSITQAFAMLYPGARGSTEAQMAQTLRFTLSQERLHPALNALDLALNAHAGVTRGDEGTAPTFRLVNSSWGQKGMEFEPAYLDVLATHYGAGVRVVDFANEADSVRERINAWVEDQTADRIENLLPEGTVTRESRLVLTNALYFKGAWRAPFLKQNTASTPFQTLGGGTRSVEMMRISAGFEMVEGAGFDAVALPYVGRAFRMVVIVPHAGRFADIESRLSAEFLDGIRAGMQPRYVDLGFPKFEVKQEFPLVEPLRALGMVDVFSDKADLSGVSRQVALKVTAAQHQAFVAVDEEGTEAAAATGVVTGPVSIPPQFVVDRPFLFLIEDVETKSVLFLGRVVNP